MDENKQEIIRVLRIDTHKYKTNNIIKKFTIKANLKNILLQKDCSICLSVLDNKTNNIIQLGCLHCFHKKCIYSWLKKKPNCPNCREICKSIIKNNNSDIDLVMHETKCSREQAIDALTLYNFDIVGAVLHLLMS